MMKKRLFSLFCVLSFLLSSLPAASALEGEAVRAADILFTLGLLQNPQYEVEQPADQATAAVILVRLAGDEAEAGTFPPLSGSPEWAARSASFAVQKGWFPVREYTPLDPITTNAWFAMLLRMLGYPAESFAPEDALLFARRVSLATRPYSAAMTRGDLFESAVDALHFPLPDGSGTVLSRLISRGVCQKTIVNALGFLDRELTVRQTADRHMAAVFCMELYDTQKAYEEGSSVNSASGFFISPDGLAVTNYHSIEGAVRGVAILVTGEIFEVERVLWFDVDMDLAVIRISRTSLMQKTASAFSCLEIAPSKDVRPGDTVYTLGNPLGMGLAVSSGIVSAVNRETDRWSTVPCIMNTADISFGSSGGALLNVYGRVIAVTSGAFRGGNNMYLAVPADLIPKLDPLPDGLTLQQMEEERQEQIEADNVE